VLGVNCDGLCMIKEDDKFIMYEYAYSQIESVGVDVCEKLLTLSLSRSLPPDTHKCFVFQTPSAAEIGALIQSYCPGLGNSKPSAAVGPQDQRRTRTVTNEDRSRLYHNVVQCRAGLLESGLLLKTSDTVNAFLRNTLRRISKNRIEKIMAAEETKGFPHTYWAFNKYPINQPLSRITEGDEATNNAIAIAMFSSLLTYAGLISNNCK